MLVTDNNNTVIRIVTLQMSRIDISFNNIKLQIVIKLICVLNKRV